MSGIFDIITVLQELPPEKGNLLEKWKQDNVKVDRALLEQNGFEEEQVNAILSINTPAAPGDVLRTPVGHDSKRQCVRGEERTDLSSEYLTSSVSSCSTPVALLDKGIEEIIDASKDQVTKNVFDASRDPAPFLFLLQSTGYGKTRAVLELAKTKRRIVYLLCKSLRNNTCGSWEVPAALSNILSAANKDSDEILWEKKWTKFLKAIVETANKYPTIQQLHEAQLKDGRLGQFYIELLTNWNAMKSPLTSPVRSAMKNNDKNSGSGENTSESPTGGSPKVSFGSPVYENAQPITKYSLIVCLDEATALSETQFRAFRRVAKHQGIISIFSDTAASICTVMPANDNSSHEGGGSLGIFTIPLYEMNTFDLFYDPLKKEEDLSNLFCAGRPRWQSIYRCLGEKSGKLDELIKKAKELLTNHGHSEDQLLVKQDFRSEGLVQAEAIIPGLVAAFTCRFSLGAKSRIAKLLAKHSLATVEYVSSNRQYVHTHYPSEPVLAEASAQFTTKDNKLGCVLDNVHAAILQGELEPPRGDLGEMCAAALLGLTMDHIRQNDKYMCNAVDLKALLDVFGLDQTRNHILTALDGWRVNFTHFVRRSGVFDAEDLVLMWKRRMACYMPAGMPGLDVLIAIWHKDKGHATLRVQVKNYSNKIANAECMNILDKLHPSVCPPSVEEQFSVGLVLSVNEIHKHCELSDFKGKRINNNSARKLRSTAKEEVAEKVVLQLTSSFPRKSREPKYKKASANPVNTLSEKLWKICSTGRSEEPWEMFEPLWNKAKAKVRSEKEEEEIANQAKAKSSETGKKASAQKPS